MSEMGIFRQLSVQLSLYLKAKASSVVQTVVHSAVKSA